MSILKNIDKELILFYFIGKQLVGCTLFFIAIVATETAAMLINCQYSVILSELYGCNLFLHYVFTLNC